MSKILNQLFPETHPLRLMYHKAKAFLAAVIYRYPGDDLIIIGVTGTKGKTTTTNMIAKILEKTGEKVGMMSTINFQIGDNKWVNNTKQTTVGPFMTQRMLRDMVSEGCKYVVLEVSSHAMTQSRVYGINFDVGVFTNLIPEHLDYHGGFEEYKKAKGSFFQLVSRCKRKGQVQKTLIANTDDAYFEYFDQFNADRKISFGMRKGMVSVQNFVSDAKGSSFTLKIPNSEKEMKLGLPGEYNVYNALAASSVALALGIDLQKVQEAFAELTYLPGRYETIDCGQEFTVVVDYAHIAESLENILQMYKKLTQGKVIVVFGATGGGRDKGKRPRMGKVADENADIVIVTDDDAYEDDEWEIIDAIAAGINRKEGENFWKIANRKEAVRLALSIAQKGDTVVIAGKGAEEVILLGGERIPYNDRKVVEEILKSEFTVAIEETESVHVSPLTRI